MFLMAKAAERLPIGTVYPVWTGIGAVGAVVVGILFLTNLLLSGESFHYNIDSIDYRTESNGLIWKGKMIRFKQSLPDVESQRILTLGRVCGMGGGRR